MENKKYYISKVYGYGGIIQYYSPDSACFATHTYINATDHVEVEIAPSLEFIRLETSWHTGVYISQPLYLICEDGNWYEFFTRTPVDTFPLNYYPEYPIGSTHIKVSKKNKNRSVQVEYGCIAFKDHFCAGIDSGSINPIDFSIHISRYTDSEIQDMVNQFSQIIQNAHIWENEYRAKLDKIKHSVEHASDNAFLHLSNYEGSFSVNGDSNMPIPASTTGKAAKKCPFCGGDFVGIFFKRCSNCGKRKKLFSSTKNDLIR